MHCLTVLIDLLDDLIQLLSCRVLAQHPHHGTQLLGADIAATVGVKHVECGLELWKKLSGNGPRYSRTGVVVSRLITREQLSHTERR